MASKSLGVFWLESPNWMPNFLIRTGLTAPNAGKKAFFVGHTPSTAGTFRKQFRKNSGKTPETLSEHFLEYPSRVRLGCSKPYNSRRLSIKTHGAPEELLTEPPPSVSLQWKDNMAKTTNMRHAHLHERKNAPKCPNATCPTSWREKMPRTAKTQHARLNERKGCPEQPKRNMPVWMKRKDAQNSECPTCPLQMKGNAQNHQNATCPLERKEKCLQQQMSDVSIVREGNALNIQKATCHVNMHTTPTMSHHRLAWQGCVHQYQILGPCGFCSAVFQ